MKKESRHSAECAASVTADSFEALAEEYGVILSVRDDVAGAVHVLKSLRDGCIPHRTATSYLQHVYAEDDTGPSRRLTGDNVAQLLDEEESLLRGVEKDIENLQPRLRAAWGRHKS